VVTLITEVLFEWFLICTVCNGLNIAENEAQWMLHLIDLTGVQHYYFVLGAECVGVHQSILLFTNKLYYTEKLGVSTTV